MRSNVCFVRSGSSWALIDTGPAGCEEPIVQGAELLFGPAARPASIFLTHAHPDHAGSLRGLVHRWRCPAYLHRDELPMVSGDLAQLKPHENPLDRWLVFPLLRLMGRRRAQAVLDTAKAWDLVTPLDSGHGASRLSRLGAGANSGSQPWPRGVLPYERLRPRRRRRACDRRPQLANRPPASPPASVGTALVHTIRLAGGQEVRRSSR